MKTSINHVFDIATKNLKMETYRSPFTSKIFRIIGFFISLFIISQLHLKLSIAFISGAIVLQVIFFLKSFQEIDLNFTFDKNDLVEIHEQLWP